MSHPTSSFPPASRPPGAAAPAEASDLYRRLHDAESSNRLRGDILQQVSDAVLLIDHEQRVVFLNAAAERRYGRVAADAVGQPLSELYTYRWLSPADEAAALAGLRERGEWRGENIHVTRDGRELHVESTVSAWRDSSGTSRGLVAVVRDITSRIQAEAGLRASEAIFRATFEESEVPQTQLAAPSGRYLRANRAFCEFVGYTFDELLQMTPLDVTASDDLDRELVRLPTVLTGQTDSYEHEKRYRRKDGRIVWGHVTATLLRDAEGRPERTVAVIQDITARKEMEAAVREADRRKDQFLATLAHELRNPLAPIRTGLALLRARDAGAPESEHIHAMMERQTVQLVRLIDDKFAEMELVISLHQQKRHEAEIMFHRLGITFAVYGEEAGAERLIPFDVLPRVITREEWRHLSAGLRQRVRALNAFLDDVYHEQLILKDERVPSDLILTNISDSVRENRLSTVEEVRHALANDETFAMLKARMAIAPQVDVTTIVALNGDVINFSRSFPPPPINLSDRDYFKALVADDKLDVFLSVPVRNRGTGTWTFYLARKVRAPDGRMLGVLLTGLHTSYFSDYFERVALAAGSAGAAEKADKPKAKAPEHKSTQSESWVPVSDTPFSLTVIGDKRPVGILQVWVGLDIPDAGLRDCLADAVAAEVADEVTREAVQIHGGYGYVKEYPVEKFWRDSKLLTIGEGTSEVQKMVIARNLIAAL